MYLAFDAKHERPVAIKLLRPEAMAKPDALDALADDINEFHVDGTTIYWHTRTPRMSDSGINPKQMEKAIDQDSTFRSIKTINNILEKWPN